MYRVYIVGFCIIVFANTSAALWRITIHSSSLFAAGLYTITLALMFQWNDRLYIKLQEAGETFQPIVLRLLVCDAIHRGQMYILTQTRF